MNSPKERVRANIYKQLLEEEKRKGKRKSYLSISLFIFGMITSFTYKTFTDEKIISPSLNVAKEDTIKHSGNELTMEHFFNTDYFEDKKLELTTEELFGLGAQI